jgi:biotin transport system substrate-specific component
MSDAALLIDNVWARPSDRANALLRAGVLVLGFALLTAGLAQFEIRLAFTPVPITGQTLGVLLAGATLGPVLGSSSQLLYWLMGMIGLPFYAGGKSGWTQATGATMGYFVGFILAAAAIGYLAQRRNDRNFASSFAAMALGTVIIYICGAGWLAHSLHIPVATGDANAIAYGVTPFLIGDAIKLIIAGALLPAAWIVVGKVKGQSDGVSDSPR